MQNIRVYLEDASIKYYSDEIVDCDVDSEKNLTIITYQKQAPGDIKTSEAFFVCGSWERYEWYLTDE